MSAAALTSGCFNQGGGTASGTASSGVIATTGSTSSSTTTSTTTTTSTGVSQFQIIMQAGSLGSFDNPTPPVAGGIAVKATRLYNLDGTLVSSAQTPLWVQEVRAFVTSTRTQAGAPALTGSDTPCAYFDSFVDNNPETSGYYTIDGYNGSSTSDVDQCAGVAADEVGKLGMYIQLDRRFMAATDKLMVIVKARPIEAPQTAPNPSTCVSGGFFDPANCVNQYYSISLRTAPYAAAKPFYTLFPSAKALDLLSENILLPTNWNTGITTISIDRQKGGAVFYGVTVIRVP